MFVTWHETGFENGFVDCKDDKQNEGREGGEPGMYSSGQTSVPESPHFGGQVASVGGSPVDRDSAIRTAGTRVTALAEDSPVENGIEGDEENKDSCFGESNLKGRE